MELKHMINPISYIIHALCILMASCSDDNDGVVEPGSDENYITSFTLTKNGETYNVAIADQNMTVTIPYNVNLDGATAKMECSEGCTIMPSPTSISDWNSERVFRAVSESGKSREYTYLIEREDVMQNGDVTLATQSEINAFVSQGINVISGNLTIGSNDNGAEKITDISSLSVLKSVSGTVAILNSYDCGDLTGIDNITSIGGLQIGTESQPSTSPIEVVTLYQCTEISGSIEIVNDNMMMVVADKLASVNGDIVVESSALQSFAIEALSMVGGDFIVNGQDTCPLVNFMPSGITSIGGELTISGCPDLATVSCAKLQTVGSVIMENTPFSLATVSFPKLTTITDNFKLESMTAYQAIGSSYTFNDKLSEIVMPKLQRVGGTLRIADFSALVDIPDLSKATIHGVSLFRINGIASTLDMSGTSFVERDGVPAHVRIDNTPVTTIKGNATMDCDFVFTDLVSIENAQTIGSLSIVNSNVAATEYSFTSIIRNFGVNNGNVSMPKLTSVGGYFYVGGDSNTISCPVLQKIGGQLCIDGKNSSWSMPSLSSICADNPSFAHDGEVTLYTGSMELGYGLYMYLSDNGTLELDKLETIGGGGWYANLYYTNKSWTTFGLPALKTVKGIMYLESTPNADTKLTELSFPSLQQADKVTINKFKRLSDFSTFATLFTNGSITSSDDWTITNCKYNPSYEDMVAGKYSN